MNDRTTFPPEPLETVTLFFNYEPGALRRAGIDVATSEGKAKIKALLLSALSDVQMKIGWHVDDDDFDQGDAESLAIADSLLAEGP
jgi:hypothetical protein